MPQTVPVEGSRKLLTAAAAAVVAFVAMSAAVATPAHAQADELQNIVFADGDEQPVTWPAFKDFDEDSPPAAMTPPGWVPQSVVTANVVSAPLPQAVIGGLFMLGGNWFAARMWKKRKF